MKNIKIVFLAAVTLFFFNTDAFSEDVIAKEIKKAKNSITNTALATKHILTGPKKAKRLMIDGIAKIDLECCEENFKYKKDLEEIKSNLESCIDKKCQNYQIPLYSKKKLPAKLIALRQVKLIDDLLAKNEKQKYQNLLTQLEVNEKNQKNIKIKDEKDIQSIKNQLLEKEKENKELKKAINKMLTNYQKQITNLKKEKKKLEDNFNLVYEAHSKYEQKKLSKQIK